MVPVGGLLQVRRPEIDPERLTRWEIDPARWRERAAAAASYLRDQGR